MSKITPNRYRVKIIDTDTNNVIADMSVSAVCGTAVSSICDGEGYGLRQISAFHTTDELLIKYTYKSAKRAAKTMKKRFKRIKGV